MWSIQLILKRDLSSRKELHSQYSIKIPKEEDVVRSIEWDNFELCEKSGPERLPRSSPLDWQIGIIYVPTEICALNKEASPVDEFLNQTIHSAKL